LLLRHLIKPHPSEAGRARGFKRLLDGWHYFLRSPPSESDETVRPTRHCGHGTDEHAEAKRSDGSEVAEILWARVTWGRIRDKHERADESKNTGASCSKTGNQNAATQLH
jgi:hypothetical protein